MKLFKKKSENLEKETEIKTEKRVIKRVALYISDTHNQIIIAPYHYNKAGISYEKEQTLQFGLNDIDSSVLGKNIIECFDDYNLKEKNLRELKLTDWPAFKASKSKSVRSFEREYYLISITGLTTDNYSVRIEARPYKDAEITLNTIISKANTDKIGSMTMKIFDMCKTGVIK